MAQRLEFDRGGFLRRICAYSDIPVMDYESVQVLVEIVILMLWVLIATRQLVNFSGIH